MSMTAGGIIAQRQETNR